MKYTKTFRNSVLRKVLPPENRSISSVAYVIIDLFDRSVVAWAIHDN